jgi:hypothetical protein
MRLEISSLDLVLEVTRSHFAFHSNVRTRFIWLLSLDTDPFASGMLLNATEIRESTDCLTTNVPCNGNKFRYISLPDFISLQLRLGSMLRGISPGSSHNNYHLGHLGHVGFAQIRFHWYYTFPKSIFLPNSNNGRSAQFRMGPDILASRSLLLWSPTKTIANPCFLLDYEPDLGTYWDKCAFL